MISDALPRWIVAIVIFLGAVHPQVPMVPMGYGYGGPMIMPPPPPPMPMPMPMPVPVPVGIPMPYPESTSTTTTTESNNGNGENGDDRIPIAVPIPVPHFLQIAIPGFMPPNCVPDNKNNGNDKGNGEKNNKCPPCPPCSCNPCTPSFFSFCSPCHLECRCKNGKENPSPRDPNPPKHFPGPAFPMPIPMPAPGPVVIVPFPPQFGKPQKPRKRPRHDSDCESRPVSDSCEESKPYDSCESGQSARKKKRKNGKGRGRNKKKKSNYDINRRNFGYMRSRNERETLVEPVLTYMSRNGDIKMERRLSNDEAHALLGGREPFGDMQPYSRARDTYNNVHLTAGEDANNKPRVLLRSETGLRGDYRRQEELLDGQSQHILGEGKKQLLFKTPDNKKISNLSVSFQITK